MKRILIFLFLLITTLALAQEPTVYIKTLTTDDGLSSNNILDIHKDALGYMWFATSNGLDRYDGYHFKHFSLDTVMGEKSLEIHKITDRKGEPGSLVLGTSNGIYIFDRMEQKIVPINRDSLGSYKKQQNINIFSICNDSLGNYWFGSYNNILYMDFNKHRIYSFKLDSKLHFSKSLWVFDLVTDNDHNLWIATNIGLLRFNTKTRRISVEYRISRGDAKINKIQIDNHGIFWLAGYDIGLIRFDPETKQIKIFKIPDKRQNYCNKVIIDKTGRIWASFLEAGLYIFERDHNRLVRVNSHFMNGQELLKGKILSFSIDNSGLIWIGSRSKGVGMVNSQPPLFYNFTFDKSWSENKLLRVFAIHEDTQGNIWLGIMGRKGLFRISPPDNALTEYNPKEFSKCRVVKIIKKDNLHFWIFTLGEGLLIFNHSTGVFTSVKMNIDKKIPFKNILTAVKDKNGDLWFAPTMGGIIHYMVTAEKGKFFPLVEERKPNMKATHIYSL